MPIYAYKCNACGFAKDVLQKISDPLLTNCPECGQATFTKQLTAAGFQLKGSGWYATDFKGGASAASAPGTSTTPAAEVKTDTPAALTATKPDAAAPASGGCGTGCACHG